MTENNEIEYHVLTWDGKQGDHFNCEVSVGEKLYDVDVYVGGNVLEVDHEGIPTRFNMFVMVDCVTELIGDYDGDDITLPHEEALAFVRTHRETILEDWEDAQADYAEQAYERQYYR